MSSLAQDLRFALRGLVRRPGFALVIVLTLALGIGANSTIFSIVYGVLLRPLAYPEADRLVKLSRRLPVAGVESAPVSAPDFLDWKSQNNVFESIAAYAPSFATMTGGEEPQDLQVVRVSADLFRALGVRPLAGRGFLPGEDEPRAAPVLVIGHRLWQRAFGGRRDVLGRTVVLDGVSYRVVGIMPPDFEFEQADLWTPLVFSSSDLLSRGRASLGVIARLRRGISLERARDDMKTVAERIAHDNPATNRQVEVAMVPLYEEIVGNVRPTLALLMGAVSCVLLIACANVGNLLLARTTDRQAELGVRVALGAGRGRLVEQTIVESLVLALLSGALSLLVSRWLIAWLVHLNPPKIPRLGDVRLDLPVVLFTFGVSLLAGALFGWGPALQTARSDVQTVLKEGGGQLAAGQGKASLREALAVVEVALALVLLIGSGLLVRSLQGLLAVDPGFRPKNVLTGFLALPQREYAAAGRQLAFSEQLLQLLRGLPGVQSVAMATSLPLGRVDSRRTFYIEGEPRSGEESPVAVVDAVSPQFFRAMGIPLLSGRAIEERDREGAPLVAVVDESLARLWFPRGDAVGRRIIVPGLAHRPRQIIGLVGAVRRYGPAADSAPQIYVPLYESSSRFLSLVLRGNADPTALASAVRRAVWRVDPNLPIDVGSLRQALDDSLAQPLFNTSLVGVLGVLALILSGVGIYAVMAYSVAQRRHEIGVRMALGGQRGQILQLILGHALKLTAVGLAVGILAAVAVTRLMAGLLFGIKASDPLTFFTLSLFLGGIALAASYLPARRATQVDPAITLRTG